MSLTPLVANTVVSYTILGTDPVTGKTNQPLLIMDPKDYNAFVNNPLGVFAAYNSPSYAFTLGNAFGDATQGQWGAAADNLVSTFTNTDYWRDMGLGVLGATGGYASLYSGEVASDAGVIVRTGGAGSAADMTTAAQLRTQLSFQQAGILDAGGQLTPQAIQNSKYIVLSGSGEISNPSIVKELTSDGSNIADWGKYTTVAAPMTNGQSMQIHYYLNSITGKIDYVSQDFKVKGVVQP